MTARQWWSDFCEDANAWWRKFSKWLCTNKKAIGFIGATSAILLTIIILTCVGCHKSDSNKKTPSSTPSVAAKRTVTTLISACENCERTLKSHTAPSLELVKSTLEDITQPIQNFKDKTEGVKSPVGGSSGSASSSFIQETSYKYKLTEQEKTNVNQAYSNVAAALKIAMTRIANPPDQSSALLKQTLDSIKNMAKKMDEDMYGPNTDSNPDGHFMLKAVEQYTPPRQPSRRDPDPVGPQIAWAEMLQGNPDRVPIQPPISTSTPTFAEVQNYISTYYDHDNRDIVAIVNKQGCVLADLTKMSVLEKNKAVAKWLLASAQEVVFQLQAADSDEGGQKNRDNDTDSDNGTDNQDGDGELDLDNDGEADADEIENAKAFQRAAAPGEWDGISPAFAVNVDDDTHHLVFCQHGIRDSQKAWYAGDFLGNVLEGHSIIRDIKRGVKNVHVFTHFDRNLTGDFKQMSGALSNYVNKVLLLFSRSFGVQNKRKVKLHFIGHSLGGLSIHWGLTMNFREIIYGETTYRYSALEILQARYMNLNISPGIILTQNSPLSGFRLSSNETVFSAMQKVARLRGVPAMFDNMAQTKKDQQILKPFMTFAAGGFVLYEMEWVVAFSNLIVDLCVRANWIDENRKVQAGKMLAKRMYHEISQQSDAYKTVREMIFRFLHKQPFRRITPVSVPAKWVNGIANFDGLRGADFKGIALGRPMEHFTNFVDIAINQIGKGDTFLAFVIAGEFEKVLMNDFMIDLRSQLDITEFRDLLLAEAKKISPGINDAEVTRENYLDLLLPDPNNPVVLFKESSKNLQNPSERMSFPTEDGSSATAAGWPLPPDVTKPMHARFIAKAPGGCVNRIVWINFMPHGKPERVFANHIVNHGMFKGRFEHTLGDVFVPIASSQAAADIISYSTNFLLRVSEDPEVSTNWVEAPQMFDFSAAQVFEVVPPKWLRDRPWKSFTWKDLDGYWQNKKFCFHLKDLWRKMAKCGHFVEQVVEIDMGPLPVSKDFGIVTKTHETREGKTVPQIISFVPAGVAVGTELKNYEKYIIQSARGTKEKKGWFGSSVATKSNFVDFEAFDSFVKTFEVGKKVTISVRERFYGREPDVNKDFKWGNRYFAYNIKNFQEMLSLLEAQPQPSADEVRNHDRFYLKGKYALFFEFMEIMDAVEFTKLNS